MSSPSLELRWGGSEIKKWGNGQKKAVRPTMTEAIEVVTQGIEHFEIEYEQPKQVSVWMASRSNPYIGHTFDSQNCEIYIPLDFVKHRKVSRMLRKITQKLFHETIHMVAFEHSPREDLIALVAGEGLACCGEHYFTSLFFPDEDDSDSTYSLANRLRVDDVVWLRQGLIEDVDLGHDVQKIHDSWFLEPAYYQGLTGGEALGILAISDMLKAGYSFPELIMLPPEELLGLNGSS